MATPDAMYCIGCAKAISKSSRDRRKLVPDSTGNLVGSVWMEEVSLQETTAEMSLQTIQAIKKEWERAYQRLFPYPLEGQKHPSGKERHDNVCHTLAVYLQTKLKPEYLPQTYGGGILPCPQISLVGVANLD